MKNEAQLILKAEGEAFEDGIYDLRKVDAIISNYRLILDHSLPLVIGQQNLTDRIKNQISYEAEFRRGSLELWLNLILENKAALGAATIDGGFQIAARVANIINSIIKFRRAWAKLLEAGSNSSTSKPGINLHLNFNDVTVNNGSINVNPIIIPAAEATKGSVDRLVSAIDGTQLEYIEIRHANTKTKLTDKDASIIGTQKQEMPSTIDILGRLYEVNFSSRKGWLSTSSGRVPVTWDEAIRDSIRSHADIENIAFAVRPIVDQRRFKDAPVAYHVLKCWLPQSSLDI